MTRLFVALLCMFSLCLPVRAEAPRIALVIGNAAYPGAGALKNPANDARDMAAKLKVLGFEVILRTNVRQKDMLRTLTEFGDKVKDGSEALFFYAGHGMQVRGRNYLIPVDAEIRSESSVSSESVDVDQLLDKLAPARLSLVILDACRNNPFERRFRGGGQGLAQINAPTGTLIAYATAPGKVAADGEGRNGLYTAELLAAMDVPGSKIEDVFKRVRANVVKKSDEAQIPWESSSLTGEFYFRGGGSASAIPAVSAPALDPAALEIAFWESADRANTTADYTAYLKKYPDGQFAELARNRLRQLPGGAQLASIAPSPSAIPQRSPQAVIESIGMPRLGDSWRFRGSTREGPDPVTHRVTKAQDGRIEISYTTNTGNRVTMRFDADWGLTEMLGEQKNTHVRFTPRVPTYQFPLQPGKRWSGQYKTEVVDCGSLCDLDVEYEYEVKGWESVTVPAGTFQALRIDGHSKHRAIFGITSVGRHTYWLVPEIRQAIKQEYFHDGKRVHEYELEAYLPAP